MVDENINFHNFYGLFAVSVTGAYKNEHAGVYTLVAETSLGTANDSFTLQIFSKPHPWSVYSCVTDMILPFELNNYYFYFVLSNH